MLSGAIKVCDLHSATKAKARRTADTTFALIYTMYRLRGPRGNSIRRVARSPVTRSAVKRSVARSMSRYLRPAAPSGPATCKHRAGNGLRRPCASGAQIHHDVDLLRAAQSRRQCGGNRLVRRAPANGPARCLSAMPVPHCERMPLGRRQKHVWIADSVHHSLSAAGDQRHC